MVLSKRTLKEDFIRCDWALYRGTTTIIQALLLGLRPIYLKLPGEINIDPLQKLQSWHTSVDNIYDFKKIILNNDSKKWTNKKWIISKNYCINFFKPFNIKKIHQIVKSI